MAVGIVTILGLLPHGMEMSRKTVNEQVFTRIFDEVVGQIQASDWTTLGGIVEKQGVNYFYDEQGLTTDLDDEITYVAHVQVPQEDLNAGGVNLIPSNSTTQLSRDLRRVIIHIVQTEKKELDFEKVPKGMAQRKFTYLATKMRE
jgi:uncharacterized protein (TIGR02598 family)